MVIKRKLKNILIKAIQSGSSPEQLTRSFCIGVYIAFSPFPGLHALILLAAKWIFNLNLPVLFFTVSVNNPWTMVPFYSFDYFFGYWLVHNMCGLTPIWCVSLTKIFGAGQVCIWSFLVGGNIAGILFAFVSYPFAKVFFKKVSLLYSTPESSAPSTERSL
jgi:uncharacterized protein (DUF2062 family)